ncbi:MAG TPA: hypothetical protein VMU28_08195 [Terriglobales bacterium]|nr:hypothetical protein [Terriglobales bacterium]
MRRIIWVPVSLLALLFTLSPRAEAQWVMVARAASKRVQQMRQTNAKGDGFEVATVILEAPAGKVYDTAVAQLRKHAELTIVKTDTGTHTIQFTKGDRTATMVASSLGPKVTQLMIGANVVAGEPSSAWQVVDGVMTICEQMKVQCTIEK